MWRKRKLALIVKAIYNLDLRGGGGAQLMALQLLWNYITLHSHLSKIDTGIRGDRTRSSGSKAFIIDTFVFSGHR